ncbi:hypothetical protein DZF91_32435 [Actinomadura logoneensis]|uniref:Uncharacterized protein n=1 Tax=Actinomadura logoneensis TaxID=2293572 RepID=A0A372JC36_9ACTN|nr:hypothetical protein DZF91_32435 [Actinomadura logoneensis]
MRADAERISAALLDLDAHPGSRLLKGARLTGETWRRWDETQRRIGRLWELFDAYGNVLDRAAALRAESERPDADALLLLSGMLTGPSVDLPDGEIPLDQRTLLGPDRRRVTLGEAVRLMSAAYEEAAAVVVAADNAWTALLLPLDEVEDDWREAARSAHELDGVRHPELDRIGRELTAFGRIVRTDPLSLVTGSGSEAKPDTSRLGALRAALDRVRAELADAVAARAGHTALVDRLTAAVDGVAEAERAARETRETVLNKIDSPGLPEPVTPSAGLRDRLAALAALCAEGRWRELAVRAAELDRAVAVAAERVEADHALSSGLLDRRSELRGRFQAYQAKAGRLGLAEDAVVSRLGERARDLLWTAPCDLRAATAALAEYQRAIRACESETGTRG